MNNDSNGKSRFKMSRRRARAVFIGLLFAGLPWISLHPQGVSTPEEPIADKFHSAAGKWTAVSNTNCFIWDSFPRKDESVTWSGSVVDGKADGRGIVQWFTNGAPTTRYEGGMKLGLADGHGISFFGGNTFEGDFKNGSMVSETITIRYATKGWYKGQQQGGFKEGDGEEMMEPGVRYVGHFKRDRYDGPGAMIWPNGDKIVGQWKDSQLSGIGTYTQTNGNSFKVKMTPNGITKL